MCYILCIFDMEKRIPPTGRGKLNLEESQNKSACQRYEILLN